MIEKVNTNGRQTGRTTELIYKCEQYNYAIIVCPTRSMAEFTFKMAQDMLCNIPMPITFKEFAEGRYEHRNVDAFLIDNLEMVLNNMARGVPIAEVVLMTGRRCPVCGRNYTDPPAISRRGEGDEICPKCGMREAIEDWEPYRGVEPEDD